MPSRSRSLLVAKGDRSERQGVGVIVDTNGHLGTVVSSKRFKDDIKPMDKASEVISYPDFRFGSLLRLFELGDRFRQKFGVPIEPRKSEGTVAGRTRNVRIWSTGLDAPRVLRCEHSGSWNRITSYE